MYYDYISCVRDYNHDDFIETDLIRQQKRDDYHFSSPWKITGLTGNADWIDLNFVELERTSELAMNFGIQLYAARLSLSETVFVADNLEVQRSGKAVYDWVQNADLQPSSGKAPNQVAVDEAVICINDQQYWLYAGVDLVRLQS